MAVDIRNFLRSSRPKPVPGSDSQDLVGRSNRYGENFLVPYPHGRNALADEGSYFTAQSSSTFVGAAPNAVSIAFVDTIGFVVFKNNAAVGTGIRCYLDYIKLTVTTASTAVQSVDFLIKSDVKDRSPSTVANGTTLTPVNNNMDDASASVAVPIIYNNTGVMTIPAASGSARLIGLAHAATGLCFAGDTIIVKFGGEPDGSTMGLTAVRAVGASQTMAHGPPVILGPQQTCVVHRWSLTEVTTATAYNLEMGWWERAA